jgi:hypothetical protein
MIMVLSFFDLLAVITNHPIQAISSIAWLTELNDVLSTLGICEHVANHFHAFSLQALLVMNFDRYLAMSCPIFHRTSVRTKRRLSLVLGLHFISDISLRVISAIGLVVFFYIAMILFFLIVVPLFLFINFRLFAIARKMRTRRNATSPESTKSMVKLKHISPCLLAIVCLVIFAFPFIFYSILIASGKLKSINFRLSLIWVNTTVTMNSTFNCLIFYWKNASLRKEGIKMLKSFKDTVLRNKIKNTHNV